MMREALNNWDERWLIDIEWEKLTMWEFNSLEIYIEAIEQNGNINGLSKPVWVVSRVLHFYLIDTRTRTRS